MAGAGSLSGDPAEVVRTSCEGLRGCAHTLRGLERLLCTPCEGIGSIATSTLLGIIPKLAKY